MGKEGHVTQKNHCGILPANTLKWWSPEALVFLSPSYVWPHKVTARGMPTSSHKILTWHQEEHGLQKRSPPSHTTDVVSSPFKAPTS